MDSQYREFPLIFNSVGIAARAVDDLLPPNSMLNADNCEELAEGAWAQRLGSLVNNSGGTVGSPVYPLSGKIVSLFKLGGLFGAAYRYAVDSAGNLWRRSGTAPGAYTKISSSLSGKPCSFASYTNTDWTSSNYAFISDSLGMFKDNGTFSAPQQNGIFPPQFPVQASVQEPDSIVLDPSISSSYTTSGMGAFTGNYNVGITGNTTAAITVPGLQAVPFSNGSIAPVTLYASLIVDTGASQETVLVVGLTTTGFIANFTKTHLTGALVEQYGWSGTVAASTTGTVALAFTGTPVSAWPTTLQQADYISFQLYVSDPTQVQSIQLSFTLGDGSTFYKVIAQGPLQNLLTTASSNSTDATTAATDALLDDSLGLYNPGSGGIAQLNTGGGWTAFLLQLSDFAGSGNADFNSLTDNWSNITGYQITIVTNDNAAPVLIEMASLLLVGGAGPDTLGGVGYDYVWTFLNPVDGTESNPSPIMTNQNPPNQTNWVYPRRQPVLLNMNVTTYGPAGQLQDGQIGYLRIYRRGGTLGDNFRRLDEIPVTISAGGIVQYTETTPDYQLAGADFVSFTNDVPVPSLLPVPVNNTVGMAINTTNQVATVTLGTPLSVFVIPIPIVVRQQVTLGSPTAISNNFETVTVLSVIFGGFGNREIVGFTAFVQNTHAIGEQVQASIKVGQPVYGMVIAFNKAWFWGDPNNPSTLYFSTGNAPQYVGEANNVIVSTPDDYITAVVPYAGNVFVSCVKSGWWMIPPDSPATQPPYPTKCKFGCIAPFGYIVTEKAIYYMAVDGIRDFAGGDSEYLSLAIEFLLQSVGSSPIVEANLSLLNQTVAAYWNSMLFFSYIGTDGNRHRLIMHTQYANRWRNDDADAQSIYLEADTNQLLYGDSNGLVHIDRQNLPTDQGASGGVLVANPIAINLQTAYSFQGSPANQKQYNAVQIDCNTGGQTLNVSVLFNDGEITVPLGTINNTQRGKINLPVNAGLGQQAYKISLLIAGNVSAWSYLFQAAVEALVLPRTRKTLDSYDMNCGGADSKICRDFFAQYSATAPITVSVYYDSNPTAAFTFTMPTAGGIRNPLRQRLPGIQFRTIRLVATSTGDFMWWQDTCLWTKFLCQGRGYEKVLIVEN